MGAWASFLTYTMPMKQTEYAEGPGALENFKSLATAILQANLGVTYEKFQQTADMVGTHGDKLDRIEHYLSSKDPQYWKRTEGH